MLLGRVRIAIPAFAGEWPSDSGYSNRGVLAWCSPDSGAFALAPCAAYEQAGGFGDNPASCP